jgi:ribosome assembly protein SQT1
MADNTIHEQHPDPSDEDAAMLDPADAEEILEDDGDAAMDSDDDDDVNDREIIGEIQLQNDSAAHFDAHKDSIFCIAQHPLHPNLVATGAGDDVGYIWDCTPAPGPVLPKSYEADPAGGSGERKGQDVLATLGGQDESVNAICYTLPRGEFVVTGTLGGTLSVFKEDGTPVGSAKEVEEINWVAPCPSKEHENVVAFGAGDGSVWVYKVDATDAASPLAIVQTFFLHQAPSTAGAWTPDGKLLATVAEDASLYVWDVFGDAAAAGVRDPNGGQAVVGLTGDDERFRVDGGLYSCAVSPGGGIVAVGGAGGHIRIIGLPRLSVPQNSTVGAKGAGARAKSGGGKQAPSQASAGQAGQILASLQAQSDGVETLDFSQPPLTLLAAGSVDGSVAIFDAAHNFAVRRHIREAHEEEAVIKVEFVKTPLGTPNLSGHLLTTCGNDGVVRRWDVRGGTATSGPGLAGEWKGHRGGGEGGGILGFVQGGGGKRVITAGDDGVSLVFETARM